MKNLLVLRIILLVAIMTFTLLSHNAFAAGAQEGTVYAVSDVPASDMKIMRDAGIKAEDYWQSTSGE
jgi:hypothetical protein